MAPAPGGRRLRNISEFVIGLLYAIGSVHQAVFTLVDSRTFYEDMAGQAWLPPAQTLVEDLLVPNSRAVTVFVVFFQAAVAVAILSRGAWVRAGLIAGGAFSIVGALTGSPAETIGYAILATVHFRLAAARSGGG